jgi:hypothetical protein
VEGFEILAEFVSIGAGGWGGRVNVRTDTPTRTIGGIS